jgi:hypothetical protein
MNKKQSENDIKNIFFARDEIVIIYSNGQTVEASFSFFFSPMIFINQNQQEHLKNI